uniref:Putative secreted protein n=1 Tax=Anopheles marajoara TaxID=58244 RepID=A0A2M4CEV2_9DIPT
MAMQRALPLAAVAVSWRVSLDLQMAGWMELLEATHGRTKRAKRTGRPRGLDDDDRDDDDDDDDCWQTI